MTHPRRLILGAFVFLALASGSVAAHLRTEFAWQLVGSFLGLLALSVLVLAAVSVYPFAGGQLGLRGQRLDLSDLARRLLPAALVVGVATGVLAPLLLGQMPLSHDHPVHLYKAWHFWEEMLLKGRLRGWSSYWFFGYPAEELYPIGPDLWVVLFRVGTFGLLSWEATYGLAFVAVFALAAYAIYSFGRRNFGAVAGVVAGLAWVLDMGDYREGGWSYTVEWAVWVQVMAMAFALLALGRLQALLDRPRPRPRDFAICGLLFAAAFLSHPMNVLIFGLALPLLLLSRTLAEGRPLGREIALTGGALGMGVLLAGFWLLPMLTRSAWTSDIGDLWRPLSQTAKGLLDGTVFANVWPLWVTLGLLGGVLAVVMRRATPIFLLCLAALLLFAASSTAFEELSLITISKSFSKIQYQRLTIPAKAALYLLAGFAVAELRARVLTWRQSPERHDAADSALTSSWARRAALAVLLCAVLAPFVRPAIEQLQAHYLRTIGGLVLKKQIHYWNDYQEFLRWSAERRASSDQFYRIAYELDRHNHLLMGAPASNHTPYYKVGYTPARLFKHVVETTEDAVYQVLSVAYVVSQRPLARPNLGLEARFGPLHVYRYKDYRPQRYTLSGPGRVEVLEFGEERIRLRLHGTGPGSRLKLHVANYARWRARQGGETLPISEAPVFGTTYPMLMEVPVRDGELRFDYVMRGVDWLGSLASLLGLGGVVLLFLVGRRRSLADKLTARFGRLGRIATRYAGWVALGLALLAGGVLAARWIRGGSGLDERSLVRLLPSAEVTQAGRPCQDRRGGKVYCSGRSWNYVGPAAEKFNGGYLPCIWAHPVEEGPLRIHFPKLRLGRAIVGGHGLADSAVEGFLGGAPVNLEIQVDGHALEKLSRPNQKGWARFRVETPHLSGKEGSLTLTVSTRAAGGRHYCFDARIEP